MAAPRPLLASALVAALLLAGCSASGDGESADRPTTTTADGPTTTTEAERTTTTTDEETTTTEATDPGEEPEAGDCWSAISGDDISAVSFAGDQVDCSDPHGGVTVGVGKVTGDAEDTIDPEVLDGDPSDPDVSGPIQDVGSDQCLDQWAEAEAGAEFDPGSIAVSGARRISKLHHTFWLPTGDEWAAGARWVRCDLQTVDGSEFGLDADELASLATKVPAELVLCFDKTNGEGNAVDCGSGAATWQAIALFQIPVGAAPPDSAAYRTLLEKTLPKVCEAVTKAVAGDVGTRAYKIFGQGDFDTSDGAFLCTARVKGPVDHPLGT